MERDAAEVVEGAAPMVSRGGIASLTVILCLLLFLPGFFSLPVTEHESHFAQASREMYESAALPPASRDPARHTGLLIPHQPSHPPLAHWLQATSAWAFSSGNPHRDSIWMYRIPSLLAAIFAVVFTRKLGTAIFDRSVGRLAALFLMVSPLLAWGSRQASADMVTLALNSGVMLGLWQAFNGSRLSVPRAMLMWSAAAGAILSGGFIALLSIVLPCITVCLLTRKSAWLRDTRPIGVLLAALIVAAWFYAAGTRMGHGKLAGAWMHAAAWPDNSTWLPPAFHAVLMTVLLWPGTLLLAAGLFVAWKLGTGRMHARADATIAERARIEQAHPGYMFLIAWLIPVWVLLEIQPGKNPVAAAAFYPPLAIIGARALLAAAAGALPGLTSSLQRVGTHLWLVVGAGWVFLILALLGLGLVVWPSSTLGTAGAGLAIGIGALIMFRALGAAWKLIRKGQYLRAALAGSGVWIVAAFLAPTIALPRYLGLGNAIASHLDRVNPSGSRPVALIGPELRSLDFLTRGRIVRIDLKEAASWLAASPGGILIRDSGSDLAGDVPSLNPIDTVTGLDTTHWQAVRIAIEERAP